MQVGAVLLDLTLIMHEQAWGLFNRPLFSLFGKCGLENRLEARESLKVKYVTSCASGIIWFSSCFM